MTTRDMLHCDVENAKDDEFGNKVTIVRCHGRLASETSGDLKAVVKPLISNGGRIILDMSNINHLDSSGLGTLVGLQASAIKQGYCKLELDNMAPRILELLRITNLTKMFTK